MGNLCYISELTCVNWSVNSLRFYYDLQTGHIFAFMRFYIGLLAKHEILIITTKPFSEYDCSKYRRGDYSLSYLLILNCSICVRPKLLVIALLFYLSGNFQEGDKQFILITI